MTAAAAAPPPPPPPPPRKAGAVIPPPQWPDEVVQQYEPVRPLGTGGFASVMLAKNKTTNRLVAIKVVGSKDATKVDHGYAHREVDILRELNHPNIMKILDFWELSTNVKCAAVMALSYSRGPTLEHLVQHGGAVSIIFGRVVMAQLVDAVAYCHGRAVIHRDIKPDNAVITGASANQDDIWHDTKSYKDLTPSDWKLLRQKWHLTLIDFGFARALSPDDLEKETVTMKNSTTINNSSTKQNNMDGSTGSSSSSRYSKGFSRRRTSSGLDRSVSHALKRTMSALGNRTYAAPEIINGVQDKADLSDAFDASRHSSANTTNHMAVDITKTLSHHVANYGMLADAFSLGNTIKFISTGVLPNQNVNEVIRSQNSPMTKFCQWLSSNVCSSSSNDKAPAGLSPRKYQYKGWKDLPEELVRLIHGMTHPGVSQRTSVRAARRYPWIDDVLQDDDTKQINDEDEEHNITASPKIDFLECTLKQHRKRSKKQQEKKASDSAPQHVGMEA